MPCCLLSTHGRYEGEFEDNNMSGYGVYVWGAEGSVYRGQASRGGWHAGAAGTQGRLARREGQAGGGGWHAGVRWGL